MKTANKINVKFPFVKTLKIFGIIFAMITLNFYWTLNLSFLVQNVSAQVMVTASSERNTSEKAVNAIDVSKSTYWGATANTLNQWIRLDLGSGQAVNGLNYQGRQDHVNGRIGGYIVETSTDSVNYTQVASGTFPNDIYFHTVKFPICNARYVRLTATSFVSGSTVIGAAEVSVNVVQTTSTALTERSGSELASNAIDFNANTYWCGNTNNTNQWIKLNLGDMYPISGLTYQGRQDSSDGRIGGYLVEVSDDDISYTQMATGTFPNDAAEHTVAFAKTVCKYIKLTGTAFVQGSTAIGAAEVKPVVSGQIYYVDNNGDDANNGITLTTPFKNISRASNVMTQGDVCYIRGGTYRETINPANSGTAGSQITYQNYNGETVNITGLDSITSAWTQYSGSIYRTVTTMSLGSYNQVFVNGTMETLARWPNNSGTLLLPTRNTVDSSPNNTTLVDADITQATDFFKDATVMLWGGSEWLAQSSTITASSDTNHSITFNQMLFTGSAYDAKAGNYYLIKNNLNCLDTEGEWFYKASDPNNGNQNTLYVWVSGGENPGTTVEKKARDYGADLSGDSYISIKGLNFTACRINMSSSTSNCVLDGINGKYLTSYGIVLNGSYNTIQNSVLDTGTGAMISVNGSYNNIINNEIKNGSTETGGAALINSYSPGADNILISNNSIHDASRACIGGAIRSSEIKYNEMYNVGWTTSDFGALYTANIDAQGTRIHHNVVHDNKATSKGAGLYIDASSHNFIIDHNLVYNCYEGFRPNTPSNYNLVYNNTLIGDTKGQGIFGVTYGNDQFGDRFFNNIYVGTVNTGGGSVSGYNLYTTDKTTVGFANVAQNDYHLATSSSAKGTGTTIQGITSTSTPDKGCYEGGDWTAGCNLSNPPSPWPTLETLITPYKNLLTNPGFESDSNGSAPSSWTKTGAMQATVITDNAWANDIAAAHTNLNGVRLGGGVDGIEQSISDLSANTKYIFSVWVKAGSGEKIEVGAKNYNGSSTVSKYYLENQWEQLIVEFTTGASNTSATVYVKKTSSGSNYAYADSCGLVVKDTAFDDQGFETGDYTGWTQGSSVPSISTAQAHSGTYSVKFDKDTCAINRDLIKLSNKIVSIWFYDDASVTNAVVAARVDDTTNWRGIGLNTATTQTKYVYRIDNTWYNSNISRSTGWHEFRWDYSLGAKLEMYIDGNKIATDTAMTKFRKIELCDYWAGATSNMYFDDLKIYDIDYDNGGFENGFGGWSTSQNPPLVTTTAYAGNKSFNLTTDTGAISRTYDSAQNNIVTLWFYDDGVTSNRLCLARVDDGTNWRGLGVHTPTASNYYVYRDGSTVVSLGSGFTRSAGWHEFKWDYTSGTDVKMYIDGNLAVTLTGVNAYNYIGFADSWTGSTGAFKLDNVQVK